MEEYNSIYDELMNKCWEKALPLGVEFELTHECNLNCRHCYIVKTHKREDELSTIEIKEIIDQLAESNIFFLTFTGGEIFMRKDFFEIATYAKKKGFNLKFLTNGALITSDVADEIKRISPIGVDVSLYGSKALTHDKITKVNGSFVRIINGIKLLCERNIKVTVKSLLMRQNFKEYFEMKELISQLGANFRYNIVINARNDGSTHPYSYRLKDKELISFLEALSQDEETKSEDEETKIIYNRETIPPEESKELFACGAGRIGCNISPTGKVFPCLMLLIEAGDLRRENFQTIWNSSEVFAKLRRLTVADLECGNCNLFYYCSMRCIGQSFLEEGDFLKCSTEARRIAKIYKKKEVSKNEQKKALHRPCD